MRLAEALAAEPLEGLSSAEASAVPIGEALSSDSRRVRPGLADAGRLDRAGRRSIRWVRSGGTGRAVDRRGVRVQSSGQRGSQSQSAEPQSPQNLRSPGLAATALVHAGAVAADVLLALDLQRAGERPRLIAKPPPPAVLRQIEQ